MCGWMLTFSFWFGLFGAGGARLGRRLLQCIVAPRVWGVWVDVIVLFLVWFVRRGEALLGHRFSHCVVASRVWGCVGGC